MSKQNPAITIAFMDGYEKGKADGYHQGYEEGREAGRMEAEEEFKKREKISFT